METSKLESVREQLDRLASRRLFAPLNDYEEADYFELARLERDLLRQSA